MSAAEPAFVLNTRPLFKLMVERRASDLFFSCNAPVKIKIEGKIFPINKQVLSPETVRQAALGMMSQEQLQHFNEELEIDFAISEPGLGRFRVNVFYQRGYPAMVLRYISAEMPRLEELGMPEIYKDLIMAKRGLILMVGATGAGKSTTLAAMINHRNETSSDHILTIEDPIEFLHTNKKSIVNQREVGLDTKSFARALRSAVRSAPDGIAKPWKPHSRWREPGTCAWRRCMPTTAPRPWIASSTCFRATSTVRSSSTCRNTCAPSFHSDWWLRRPVNGSRPRKSW
jgi:twitching motility protein PilU